MTCNPIAWQMWLDAGSLSARFDAVHASAFPYGWPIACAWRLARGLRIPFFLTPFLHLGDPTDSRDRTRRNYTSAPLRWLLEQADGVFVQTPSERDAVLSLGLAEDKVILQGLGVAIEECTGGNREAARRRWHLPADAVVVGHLANHSFEKGTIDLVQALERLWRRGRPIYLLLAGPQMPGFVRFWNEFESRCPALVQERVRVLGTVSEPEKADFFASLDLFALPSRSDSFGLVLLEAWANGLANVAYRAGGPADVIRHQCDGVLVPCGDIGGLTEAVDSLAGRPEWRRKLGANGRARLRADFHWPDKLALVRQCLEEKRTSKLNQRAGRVSDLGLVPSLTHPARSQ
jgi:glycosyltransferase involved in cell wall biosynthesis